LTERNQLRGSVERVERVKQGANLHLQYKYFMMLHGLLLTPKTPRTQTPKNEEHSPTH